MRPVTTTQPDSVIAKNTLIPLVFPWSEVQPVYTQVLNRLAKQVKNPGFRVGKVPPAIAKDLIGEEKLVQETFKKILSTKYQAAIKDQKLEPLTQPEFQIKSALLNESWEVEAAIAEKPQVIIKGYEKIAQKAKTAAQTELKNQQAEAKKTKKSDNPDQATPKPAAPEPTAEDQAAELKDTQLRFIFRELIMGIKPAIPELLLKEEARAELEKLVRDLSQIKISLDDYLARRKMGFDQLSNELASQVLGQLQLEFILEAISAEKKFKISDEDYQTYFQKIEDEKTRATYQKDPQYVAYLTRIITRQKVIDHLLSL